MALGRIKRNRAKVAKAGRGERSLQVSVRIWRASVPGYYVATACLRRGPGTLTAGSAKASARCGMGKRSGTPTGAIKNALKMLGKKIR